MTDEFRELFDDEGTNIRDLKNQIINSRRNREMTVNGGATDRQLYQRNVNFDLHIDVGGVCLVDIAWDLPCRELPHERKNMGSHLLEVCRTYSVEGDKVKA